MTPDVIKGMIEQGMPGCTADVVGDDGAHFEAIIVSDQFEGLSLVKQHQLVYKSLGDSIGGAIHALSIKTLTPGELEKQRRNEA